MLAAAVLRFSPKQANGWLCFSLGIFGKLPNATYHWIKFWFLVASRLVGVAIGVFSRAQTFSKIKFTEFRTIFSII